MAFGDTNRRKIGVEEEAALVFSNSFLEGVIDDNIEDAVSGTEDVTKRDTDGEVMGSIHGISDRSKLGGS